ncbi:unnamed protein product [Musa acuminata var. zebrina]
MAPQYHIPVHLVLLIHRRRWRRIDQQPLCHVQVSLHAEVEPVLHEERVVDCLHCHHVILHLLGDVVGLRLGLECLGRACGCLADVDGAGGLRDGEEPRGVGEVEAGGAAPEGHGGHVVGTGGHLGGGEGAQPDPRLLVGLPHLAHPLVPVAAPHALVHRMPRLPELGAPRPPLRRRRQHRRVGDLLVRPRPSRHRRIQRVAANALHSPFLLFLCCCCCCGVEREAGSGSRAMRSSLSG